MQNYISDLKPHTLQIFDGELAQLHQMLIKMADLVFLQMDQLMSVLEHREVDLLMDIIARDANINEFDEQIDAEVMVVIARQAPVANDLNVIMTTSKTAVELEKLGDEIVELAKTLLALFNQGNVSPTVKLLTEVVSMGNLIRLMLSRLNQLMENQDVSIAYDLLEYDKQCKIELEFGIKRQLNLVVEDSRLIGLGLNIMQSLKSLERCSEYCRNIAGYIIYLVSGVDIHKNQQVTH